MTPAYCPKCGSPWFKLKTESRTMPPRRVGTLNTRVDIFLKIYYRCDVCHWEWYPPDVFRESENRKPQKKEQHHAQP